MLLLGILIASIMILLGVGGDILLFINIQSILIVLGISLALILASYGGKGLGLVFKAPFARNMSKEDIKKCINIYKDLKVYLIVSGFIGTLIGLILMGANLTDLDALGPGLALSLITILYGLLAYIISLPIQRRLEQSVAD